MPSEYPIEKIIYTTSDGTQFMSIRDAMKWEKILKCINENVPYQDNREAVINFIYEFQNVLKENL